MSRNRLSYKVVSFLLILFGFILFTPSISISQVLLYITADPIAGDPVDDIVVPHGETWQIQSIRFSLNTSSTAGNRLVFISIRDSAGTSTFMEISAGFLQGPSINAVYNFSAGTAFSSVTATNRFVTAPLPTDFKLEGDMIINIGAEDFKTLDNFYKVVVAYVRL